MTRYVSVTSWQVLEFHSGILSGSHPEQIVGPDPLDPPDETYIWPDVDQISGPIEIGVALFDPIDVTSDPSPRFRVRASGTVSGGGFDVGLQVQIIAGTAPYDQSAQIGSFIYPFPTSWRVATPGYYEMGSVQEAEFYIPPAAQAALADPDGNGLSVWLGVNGSGEGDPSHIGMKIHEFRIVLSGGQPAPLRLYPRSSTRLYPRRRTRRPGTF